MTPVILLVVCGWLSSAVAVEVLSLNGEWTVYTVDKNISVSGTVPGSMYTALMASGDLGDPYYRDHDTKYRWVSLEDWTYTTTFTVSRELLSHSTVMLVCEGLDTVSTVKVNDQTVGSSDNMFIRYVYNIKEALLEGENTISIEFRSAQSYVSDVSDSMPYPILPECQHPQYQPACGANLIRKMQCSFSWDWGPAFPTQGIWRDIYVQAYNAAVVRDVTTETIKNDDGGWQLKVDVYTEVDIGDMGSKEGQLELILGDSILQSTLDVNLTQQHSKSSFDITVPQGTVDSWWPNGYGKQALYDLTVTFTEMGGYNNSKNIRFGFRTVELVQDLVDTTDESKGRSFYFRINGRPIFLKGSNWIPADSFLERITEDRMRMYLGYAADVHMNAMRVWGGGIYEFDKFYEIADELGIMIWQDFMFACSMYPATDEFLENAKQEVTYQVRRLKHHPSVIILAGNNENEAALRDNWYGTGDNFDRYKQDYLKLYVETMRATVLAEDSSRPFVPSSPSNGDHVVEEGWVSTNPSNTKYGDNHEYKYYVPFYDPSQYFITRMCSEYGMQSLPSLEGLAAVYNEADMEYESQLNNYRNHHPRGNFEMMNELKMYFDEPTNIVEKERFGYISYLTQLSQAIGMKTMAENHRRWQNRIDNQGQGNTMGSLYWMLADIWQAPTWSSIEYGGKWKALHYYAEQFFAPTLISPFIDGEYVDVYVVIDELPVYDERDPDKHTIHFKPRSNPRPFRMYDESVDSNSTDDFSGNLYMDVYSWNNNSPIYTYKIPFTVNSTSESVYRTRISDLVAEVGGDNANSLLLTFHLGDAVDGPTNWLPLTIIKNASGIQTANIQIANVTSTDDDNLFTINVESDHITPFVWLEATGIGGRFSDNGFMLYQPSKTLTFLARENIKLEELTNSLKLTSLQDAYQ